MSNLIYALSFSLLLVPFSDKTIETATKTIVGTWISVDDKTGEERSHIKIYKSKNGLYYGKILKLLFKPEGQDNPICTNCPKDDYRYNQPIKGLVVISQLKGSKDLKSAVRGKVLDPETGYIVDCQIELDEDNDDILKVRGYWKMVSIGVTQTWKRLE
ncbi:MAG: DUF2147 domain-containing protein [Saprospiraceae bacterium]|nr:DUF2147 domain-containing protein [Saprospiraceae bacterium]